MMRFLQKPQALSCLKLPAVNEDASDAQGEQMLHCSGGTGRMFQAQHQAAVASFQTPVTRTGADAVYKQTSGGIGPAKRHKKGSLESFLIKH